MAKKHHNVKTADDENDGVYKDDDADDETNGETWGHGISRPSTPVMLVTPHRPQHGDHDDDDDDLGQSC